MKAGRVMCTRSAIPRAGSSVIALLSTPTMNTKGERLFRTVGADHTFYGPPTAKLLGHYASLLPAGFKMCTKVWEEITVPVYPSGLRYAKKAGPNPHFLDAKYFEEQVLSPFDEAFQAHTGPFIFEFQRTGIEVTSPPKTTAG
jgi:uncharacterized protein YecE (DUF72 family)